jgi:hypothetical protein
MVYGNGLNHMENHGTVMILIPRHNNISIASQQAHGFHRKDLASCDHPV